MTRRAPPRPTWEEVQAAKRAEAEERREAEAELNRAVAQRLRWARELVYETSQEFAHVLGITKSMYHHIEHGKRSLSLLNLVTAANKLLVGTEYLLTGDLFAVEASMRRALVDRHPELGMPGWVPDPAAPKPLLVPHRPSRRVASGHKDIPIPARGKRSHHWDTETPPVPTKQVAADG